MTKKHFIALAQRIQKHNGTLAHRQKYFGGASGRGQFTAEQLEALADFCASQNPRFNRDRWFGYIAGTNGPNGGAH